MWPLRINETVKRFKRLFLFATLAINEHWNNESRASDSTIDWLKHSYNKGIHDVEGWLGEGLGWRWSTFCWRNGLVNGKKLLDATIVWWLPQRSSCLTRNDLLQIFFVADYCRQFSDPLWGRFSCNKSTTISSHIFGESLIVFCIDG